MLLIVATLALMLAMTANHLVHGTGCWGLQPGGMNSRYIYDSQIILAIFGFVWLVISVATRSTKSKPLQLAVILVLGAASIYTFSTHGWTYRTSIHKLGPENLIAYLTLAFTTYFVGRYVHSHRQGKQTDSKF